jgi:hypothetical protein
METVCFSETVVSTYKTARRHNLEEQHRQFQNAVLTAKKTKRLRFKYQLVNTPYGNNRCLFWELYETHKYTL